MYIQCQSEKLTAAFSTRCAVRIYTVLYLVVFPFSIPIKNVNVPRTKRVSSPSLGIFFFTKANPGINECPRVRFLRIAVLVLFASRHALRLYVVLIDERDNNSDSWHDAALI